MSSTIIGLQPYRFFAEEFEKPVVVAGFEPLDVAQAILMLVRQINEGRHEVENQYIRAVSETGNEKAQAEVAEVFELRERFEWRGLGEVPYGALRLRAAYESFDAEKRFALIETPARDNPACECGAILRGVKKPRDCKLFGTLCTPDTPMGSCMVSPEGACSAHWTYGRFREATQRRRPARRSRDRAATDPPQARSQERSRRPLARRRRPGDGTVDRGRLS